MFDECLSFVYPDSNKLYFTPEGSRYFNTTDDMLDYIAEKCGEDIKSCFHFEDAGEAFVALANFPILEYEEFLEDDATMSPVLKMKKMKKMLSDSLELIRGLTDTIL